MQLAIDVAGAPEDRDEMPAFRQTCPQLLREGLEPAVVRGNPTRAEDPDAHSRCFGIVHAGDPST